MPLQTSFFDPRKPFNRADARAACIPRTELLSSAFQRVFYNVYVSSGVKLDTLTRARAALAVSGSGAYASHHTAAQLWGGCPPDTEHVHVSVPDGAPRTERQGIKAHRAVAQGRISDHRGVQLSTPTQCFLEIARGGASLIELVVLGDSLVRAGHLNVEQLVHASTSWVGVGAKIARRAARLVRAGVDSPMESRLRMLIVLAGLPEPEVNVIVRDEDGEWVMRFDLSYPGLKMLIEYDGRQHGADGDQWKRDARRREALDRQGWRMILVHSDGIYIDPLNTLMRIRALLLERGGRVPARFATQWSRHFPRKAA